MWSLLLLSLLLFISSPGSASGSSWLPRWIACFFLVIKWFFLVDCRTGKNRIGGPIEGPPKTLRYYGVVSFGVCFYRRDVQRVFLSFYFFKLRFTFVCPHFQCVFKYFLCTIFFDICVPLIFTSSYPQRSWSFKLRVTVARACVASTRSIKVVTDVELAQASEGSQAPLLVVGEGRAFAVPPGEGARGVMALVRKVSIFFYWNFLISSFLFNYCMQCLVDRKYFCELNAGFLQIRSGIQLPVCRKFFRKNSYLSFIFLKNAYVYI